MENKEEKIIVDARILNSLAKTIKSLKTQVLQLETELKVLKRGIK